MTAVIVGMIFDPDTAIAQARGGQLGAASQVVRDYARLLRLHEAEPDLDMLTIGKEYFGGDVIGPHHSYYNVDISSYSRGWKRVTSLNKSPIATITYDWVRMPAGYDHFLCTHLDQLIHNHLQRATAPPYAAEVQYIIPSSPATLQCITAGYPLISQFCSIEIWRGEERMKHPLFAATTTADLIYGECILDRGFIVIRHRQEVTSKESRAQSAATLRQQAGLSRLRPQGTTQSVRESGRSKSSSVTADMPQPADLIKAWRASEDEARARSRLGVLGTSGDTQFALALTTTSSRTLRARMDRWTRDGTFTAASLQQVVGPTCKYSPRLRLASDTRGCTSDGLCGYRMLRLALARQETGTAHPADLDLTTDAGLQEMVDWLHRLRTLPLTGDAHQAADTHTRLDKTIAWTAVYKTHQTSGNTFMAKSTGGWLGTHSFDSLATALQLRAVLAAHTPMQGEGRFGDLVGDSHHSGPTGDGLAGAYTLAQLRHTFSRGSINICGYQNDHYYLEPMAEPTEWGPRIDSSLSALWTESEREG